MQFDLNFEEENLPTPVTADSPSPQKEPRRRSYGMPRLNEDYRVNVKVEEDAYMQDYVTPNKITKVNLKSARRTITIDSSDDESPEKKKIISDFDSNKGKFGDFSSDAFEEVYLLISVYTYLHLNIHILIHIINFSRMILKFLRSHQLIILRKAKTINCLIHYESFQTRAKKHRLILHKK